jgi:hypothetical protein
VLSAGGTRLGDGSAELQGLEEGGQKPCRAPVTQEQGGIDLHGRWPAMEGACRTGRDLHQRQELPPPMRPGQRRARSSLGVNCLSSDLGEGAHDQGVGVGWDVEREREMAAGSLCARGRRMHCLACVRRLASS